MKKVLLIATGGTIASKQTEEGLSPALSAEEIIAFVPELQKIAELSIVQLCNVDSTNMQPKIWREMGLVFKKTMTVMTALWFCMARIPWLIPLRR